MISKAGKILMFIKHLFSYMLCKSKGINFKIIVLLTVILVYYFGAFTHIFELDYYNQFKYPLDGNIINCINWMDSNSHNKCKIINRYNYSYILNKPDKCTVKTTDTVRLVIIVKSAGSNVLRRMAIRKSWGYEKRFSDVIIKTVFILGINNKSLNRLINEEYIQYGDIVQSDFMDTYYNNTIKTMMSLKWAVSYCKNARFYLFVDDDMYVSISNLLLFLRSPTEYPYYNRINYRTNNHSRYIYNFDLPENVKLYAGSVTVAAPQRHFCSKWYVSLADYPFHLYPPYVSGGALIFSQKSLEQFYYASHFTKRFTFDDVYLGIIAKKLNIEPFHSQHFHMFKLPYHKHKYNYTIVSHGYGDPKELFTVWSEQRSLGHA